jgi:hypothetical protein
VARDRDALARPYAARILRAERAGLSRAQARGHPKPGEQSISQFRGLHSWTVTFPADDPPRLVTVQTDYRTAQRVGRYDRTLRLLREARISPNEFRRRARRVQPIGELRVVSDPRVALALTEASTRDEWIFESGRQRPRRSRSV